jgi:hypothetical protein
MTVTYPHLREASTTTLGDLAERHLPSNEALSIDSGSEVTVSHDLSEIAIVTTGTTRTVPCTEDGLNALAQWTSFPQSFFDRIDTDLKADWLNELLHRKQTRGVVRLGERTGIISVMAPNQLPIDPSLIIGVATEVLGRDALVVESSMTASSFDLDVVTVTTDLGDPQVGDITRGGLRYSLNLGQNLAPKVSPYHYRLWCTNGASRFVEMAKIDARGLDSVDLLAELEAKSRLAYEMVTREVDAMYALRSEKVSNPERTLNRMAAEHGLSDRLRIHAITALPSMVDDVNDVSMFDLINAVSHLANSPKVRTRGARLSLESFGATVIAQHIERCASCQSRLN